MYDDHNIAPSPSKRASFSSKASQLPQKIVQSFNIRQQTSSNSGPTHQNKGAKLSNGIAAASDNFPTRISQMIFRQRSSNEEHQKCLTTAAIESAFTAQPSNSRQPYTHPQQQQQQKVSNSLFLKTLKSNNENNNEMPSTATAGAATAAKAAIREAAPYLALSPPESYETERTIQQEMLASNKLTTTVVNGRFSSPPFSPLSFTGANNYHSSEEATFLNYPMNPNFTPPLSPMLSIFNSTGSSPIVTNAASPTAQPNMIGLPVTAFAKHLMERCVNAQANLKFYPPSSCGYLQELLELILDDVRLLIDACSEPLCYSIEEDIIDLENRRSFICMNVKDKLLYPITAGTRSNKFAHSNRIEEDPEYAISSAIDEVKTMIQRCFEILARNTAKNSLSVCPSEKFIKEEPKIVTCGLQPYRNYAPDKIDPDATWFRYHFVGKPYRTFIGRIKYPDSMGSISSFESITSDRRRHSNSTKSKSTVRSSSSLSSLESNSKVSSRKTSSDTDDASFALISIIQERAKDFAGLGNSAASILGTQYRIIVRTKEPKQARFVIHESMAKETRTRLERLNEGYKLEQVAANDRRTAKAFTSRSKNQCVLGSSPHGGDSVDNSQSSKMLRSALLTVCPNVELPLLKELTAESTIMAGLEKDLLKYDELHIPKRYKFGILTIRDDQTTEEAWFSNTGLSRDLHHFLATMGRKVELKGYTGYAAGLDTKTGESGKYAYVSKWNDFDIVYHVASIMPSQTNDKQQVLRKKHIGNDIVCIIFLEGKQNFDPEAIRSQFLHVYIIVRPETSGGRQFWRIEVLRKNGIEDFGPPLPSPPVLFDDDALRDYLTVKLINAENAALKSEKFFTPNNRARLGLLTAHVQAGLSFSRPQMTRSVSTHRLSSTKSAAQTVHHTTDLSSLQQQQQQKKQQQQRPKSASGKPLNHSGQQHILSASSRLFDAAGTASDLGGTDYSTSQDIIPPMPEVSKSTLLQDFKKGVRSSTKIFKNTRSSANSTLDDRRATPPHPSSVTYTDSSQSAGGRRANNKR